MLKSIQKLKGFGVFDNYSSPEGTSEFGVKNIIYGWNYSGKTTLSRLIATLETKQTPEDFPSCSFSIATDTTPITEANIASAALEVRVFNTDFVANNINTQKMFPNLLRSYAPKGDLKSAVVLSSPTQYVIVSS